MTQIRQRDALDALTRPRLLEIAAALGLCAPARWSKSEILDALASSPRAQPSRDELKVICRAAGIEDSGREKTVIVERILGRKPGRTRVSNSNCLVGLVYPLGDFPPISRQQFTFGATQHK